MGNSIIRLFGSDFKRRIIYSIIAFFVFSAGVCLVLFGRHFPHLRGWFGDYLVTIFLFFSVKAAVPRLNRIKLSIGVFVFSSAVELLQLSGISAYFNLTSLFWQLTIGSRFDVYDILLYAAGCVSAAGIDFILSGLYNK